jgi:hypothetical protein
MSISDADWRRFVMTFLWPSGRLAVLWRSHRHHDPYDTALSAPAPGVSDSTSSRPRASNGRSPAFDAAVFAIPMAYTPARHGSQSRRVAVCANDLARLGPREQIP